MDPDFLHSDGHQGVNMLTITANFPQQAYHKTYQGLVAFLILSNVILSLVWIFQRIPVDEAWDAKKQKTAKCYTQGQIQRVNNLSS